MVSPSKPCDYNSIRENSMFNIEMIESEVVNIRNINVSAMSIEHCGMALVAETLADMCRPIMRLSTNERIASQQQFNRGIALLVKNADGSTIDSLQELAKQAAFRLATAQQEGDEEVILEAQERLEKVINFFGDTAGNVTRNAFYRHEECERMETAVADSGVVGVDGAIGAFETKSKYAGWMNYSVEADVMKDATKESVKGLLAVVGALLPMASAYLQGLLTKQVKVNKEHSKAKVHVQLGYYKDQATGEAEQYYTVQDAWNSIKTHRKTAKAPMAASEALAAFKL